MDIDRYRGRSANDNHQRQQHHNRPLPEVGSIEPGTISRVEPYGAFCQLNNYRGLRGLIHISQLANIRVENVNDVVGVDDSVWVKVLEVSQEPNPDPSRPPRTKLSLSMKDASQDGSCEDLGAEREKQEQVTATIEHSLSSSIGMGVARDPMAQGLVLKHNKNKQSSSQLFNGYALVGDDEGEPEPELPVKSVRSVEPVVASPKPPVGRGRGVNLPAWMTKPTDGPTGSKDSEDEDSRDRRRKSRKHKKDRKKSSSRKHHHKRSSKSDRRHRKRRKRDRYSSDDSSRSEEDDDSSRGEDRSRDRPRKHRRRRSRSRSRSRDRKDD